MVYSISGGVGERRPNVNFFNRLGAVTVFDEASLHQLQAWGVRNAFLVRTGIDVDHFTYTPPPPGAQIRLMMGSAPWTVAQFRSKGVEALLAAAQQAPYLHIVFLWRGVLGDEMRAHIRRLHLQDQVTIIDRLVDVNEVLATVHASIVLANRANIVKAYPHSLLDSLAAGKPVLVGRAIPMARYVEKSGCGGVVETVTPDGILAALKKLIADYASAQQAAQTVGRRDFSQQAMIDSFQQVYTHASNAAWRT